MNIQRLQQLKHFFEENPGRFDYTAYARDKEDTRNVGNYKDVWSLLSEDSSLGCIAGWTIKLFLSKSELDNLVVTVEGFQTTVESIAMKLLDLTMLEANWLFSGTRVDNISDDGNEMEYNNDSLELALKKLEILIN